MRSYAKDIADAPKSESMINRRFWRRWRALFNWKYMRNYLKSQVGRKWDDIWSDIAATHDTRNYSEAEFRKEIAEEVYFDVTIDENGIYDRRGGRIRACGRAEYYVDEDGVLKALPKDKRYRYTPPESKIVRFNGFEYYKYDGLWYEVVTKPLTQIRAMNNFEWIPLNYRRTYKDAFGVFHFDCEFVYKEPVAVISKRAVGKRVIRKINEFLENKYYD